MTIIKSFKSKFKDKKFICEICQNYETNLKKNLKRHKLDCQKYKCHHCARIFRTKLLLKAHQKEIEKLEKMNRLMEFVRNADGNNMNSLMDQMELEENQENRNSHEEKLSQNNSELNERIKNGERTSEIKEGKPKMKRMKNN